MKLSFSADSLSVEKVHALVDQGYFPFLLCPSCGAVPASIDVVQSVWRAHCPVCDLETLASALSWRDAPAAKELGWELSPSADEPAILLDDRRNKAT